MCKYVYMWAAGRAASRAGGRTGGRAGVLACVGMAMACHLHARPMTSCWSSTSATGQPRAEIMYSTWETTYSSRTFNMIDCNKWLI